MTDRRNDSFGQVLGEALRPPVPLAAGSVVGGRYELEAIAGRGGFAEVWKAKDQGNHGLRVAVKLYSGLVRGAAEHDEHATTEPGDAGVLVDHEREVAALRELVLRVHGEGSHRTHPNIVGFMGSGEHLVAPGRVVPFLVFEWLGPETEYKDLGSARRPPRQVARLGHVLARTLKFAHACGVTHLDLTPRNVRLLGDAQLKLLDFGISKVYGLDLDRAAVTTAAHARGTPGFRAPEQAAAPVRVSGATDVYGLGALMFALLVGPDVHAAHTTTFGCLDATASSVLDQRVPEPLRALIAAALAREPGERPTMAAVAATLAEAECWTFAEGWSFDNDVSVAARTRALRTSVEARLEELAAGNLDTARQEREGYENGKVPPTRVIMCSLVLGNQRQRKLPRPCSKGLRELLDIQEARSGYQFNIGNAHYVVDAEDVEGFVQEFLRSSANSPK